MAGIQIHDFEVKRPAGRCLEIAHEFEALLERTPGENEIQAFLEQNPIILSQQLPHCHHVVPKPRLGSEYVPDFMLPEMNSGGTQWYLVELEPCFGSLVTTKGVFTERVRGAIQQIRDWRSWLSQNLDYASKPVPQHGLGLSEIQNRPAAWIVAGRRSQITDRFNQLRQQVWENDLIEIKTYDRLLEWWKQRAEMWNDWDQNGPISYIGENQD